MERFASSSHQNSLSLQKKKKTWRNYTTSKYIVPVFYETDFHLKANKIMFYILLLLFLKNYKKSQIKYSLLVGFLTLIKLLNLSLFFSL